MPAMCSNKGNKCRHAQKGIIIAMASALVRADAATYLKTQCSWNTHFGMQCCDCHACLVRL
jgi:hypothetical protein